MINGSSDRRYPGAPLAAPRVTGCRGDRLHRPSPALGRAAAVPGDRGHIPDLLPAAVGQPGDPARGPKRLTQGDRRDQQGSGAQPPDLCAVLELHQGDHLPRQLRLLLLLQRSRWRPDRQPPSGHSLAHRRRGRAMGPDRDPRGHHLRDQAPHLLRPRGDGSSARVRLGARLLARADRALPLCQRHRPVQDLPGLGQLRRPHREPAQVVRVAAAALDGALGHVDRDLCAPGARQPAAGHGRGLHPHGASQGPTRAHSDSQARDALRDRAHW